jgi:hypothetical protein
MRSELGGRRGPNVLMLQNRLRIRPLSWLACAFLVAVGHLPPAYIQAADAWYAGPWLIQYHAAVRLPQESVRTKEDGVLTEYQLIFDSGTTFTATDKGGISISHLLGQFRHKANWTTADGSKHAYGFVSSGELTLEGGFTAQGITLKTVWQSGRGQGTSDGKPITTPIGEHRVEAQWVLKRQADRPKRDGGPATTKIVFSAERTTKMPQQLAGCPPLDLDEYLVVRQPDIADLELTVKELKRPAQGAGTYNLILTLKNLGPDGSGGARLRVVLPAGATSRVKGDGALTDGRMVAISVPSLAAGATTDVEIPFWLDQPPDPSDTTAGIILVEVTGPAYDPHTHNNSLLPRIGDEAKSP